MTKRLAVVCGSMVVLLALGVTTAYAGFPGDPVASDIETWYTIVNDVQYQVVVEQKVFEGTSVDAGYWKYQYEVVNDGSGPGGSVIGLGSPLTGFGFDETVEGHVGAHFEPAGWDFRMTGADNNLTHAPYWYTTDPDNYGIGPSATEALVVAFISGNYPDKFYNGKAKDTVIDRVVSGKTTGPTPEPCSGLLLVASACGLYGFLRRRRE